MHDMKATENQPKLKFKKKEKKKKFIHGFPEKDTMAGNTLHRGRGNKAVGAVHGNHGLTS